MGGVESFGDFWVNNHKVIHNQVRNQGVDHLPLIQYIEPPLLFDAVTAFSKFDDEGVFVSLFIQTGSKGIEDLDGCTDDFLTQFFMNQWLSVHEP